MELQETSNYAIQLLTICAPIGLTLSVCGRILRFAIGFFTGRDVEL